MRGLRLKLALIFVGSVVAVVFVATAITARMTASEFVDLDLAYAPAVSPMWDAFQLAARSTLT